MAKNVHRMTYVMLFIDDICVRKPLLHLVKTNQMSEEGMLVVNYLNLSRMSCRCSFIRNKRVSLSFHSQLASFPAKVPPQGAAI